MKLRKLILSGFKSFADKTEFEFDDGISCIVGPNGCGKSNVVDAVKWVLGEQSAKSLRGSEMMDVIFNGSTSRKSGGGAEVTLVFDNADGMLRPDGDEQAPKTVAVTRRLFRSGHSEYLLNKRQCRLKDVREMFLDTGNAYSLIEQGRIENFLQAGQDERRAIFDEVAGISKYKARKKDAIRKLDRVEQNLLRINDILAEVEKRLRSIKYQAGKARSYQAYSERLRQLRSLHFLSQYHTHRSRRAEIQKRLDSGSDRLNQLDTRIGQLETAQSGTEVEALNLDRGARDLQSQIASVSGRITTCQERSDMLTGRVGELGEQIVAAAKRCEDIEAKLADLQAQADARRTDLQKVEATAGEFERHCQALSRSRHDGEMALAKLQGQVEDAKAGMIDLLRRTAQLHNEIHGLGIRRENLGGRRERLGKRAGEISASIEKMLGEKSLVEAKLADAQAVIADAGQRLDQAKARSASLDQDSNSLRASLAEAREKRSAVASRIDTLREMQQTRSGLGEGVRRVLAAGEQGLLPSVVVGVLGELIRTDREHASVVEAALAGADQQLVVEHLAEVERLAGRLKEVIGDGGAVEVLCLDQLSAAAEGVKIAPPTGAIALVSDWVRADPRVSAGVAALLGRTAVVASLSEAVAAAGQKPCSFRYVTLSGDVLEADGRLRLGAANRASGMISRGSELEELTAGQARLDDQIAELARKCRSAKDELEHLDELQQKLRTAIYEANTERVECQTRANQLGEQIAKLESERPLIAADLDAMAEEIAQAVQAEQQARQSAAELERNSEARKAEVAALAEEIAVATRQRDQQAGELTELRVELGRAEEKRRSIRDAIADLTRQYQQMQQDLAESRSEIELNRSRRLDAEKGAAAARQEIDSLYARQQQLTAEADDLDQSRKGLAERLQEIRDQLAAQRTDRQQLAEQVNSLRVELGEADVRLENLVTRAGDEMSMDLLELFKTYQHDEARDWDAVAAEIEQLRGKIDRLGNINLDAIAEQEDLEQRRGFLVGQLGDVQSSRDRLNELIRRINKTSVQMFTETFATVRENFQQLFRKLFGGGRADVLLTDPQDVLESGIEIVAKPPGKELRTLSLLSGGEKTMTGLALLFSIFRSRPSPFCLLDEVDAALDEANTDRFSRLLEEFNQQSQFVVITHAKRTMAIAGVLYGVTMQEPGVSKRISVRFAEVDRTLESQPGPAEPVSA